MAEWELPEEEKEDSKMTGLLKDTKNVIGKSWIQGFIAAILALSLCYAVLFGGQAAEYKDLFAYAVSGTLGFYFGRETKAGNQN